MLNNENEPRLRFNKLALKLDSNQSSLESRSRSPTDKAIMCFAASQKHMAVAISACNVFIYEMGQTTPLFEIEPKFTMRPCALSFDSTGDLLLACSIDRELVLVSMQGRNVIKRHTHKAQLQNCLIDPDSAKNPNLLSCVFSDMSGSVWRVKPSTSFLKSSYSSEVIEIAKESQGIDTFAWKDDLIIWGSYKRYTIFRASKNEKIKVCEPASQNFEYKYPRWSIVFTGNEQFTVSFGGMVTDVLVQGTKVTETVVAKKTNCQVLSKKGGLTAKFIAEEKEPAIFEIETDNDKYEDKVPVENVDTKAFMNIYPATNDDFFLVLSSGIIAVSRLSNEEKIDYYLSTNNIELCLKKFREIKLSMSNEHRISLILKICKHLLDHDDVAKTIDVCQEFGEDCDWTQIISFFRDLGKLELIASYVPIDRISLQPGDVTDILRIIVKGDATLFCQRFHPLKPGSFEASKVIGDVSIRAEEDPGFMGCLMTLQHMLGEHQKALRTGVEIGYPEFFDDIVKFEQYKFVLTGVNFGLILQKYTDKFTKFLMDHVTQLDPITVLEVINTEVDRTVSLEPIDPRRAAAERHNLEKCKLRYLDNLRELDHAIMKNEKYGTELALMYIKFNDPRTMEFFRTTVTFDLKVAKKASIDHHMYREAAFLCQKMGDLSGGMSLIIEHLDDPNEALKYATESSRARSEKDKEMWRMLTKEAYRNPKYLRVMLENLPNLKLKAVKFIRNIPDTSVIPDFEELAARTVKEYKRKERTAELAQQIVARDAFGAFKRSFDNYKRGKPTTF